MYEKLKKLVINLVEDNFEFVCKKLREHSIEVPQQLKDEVFSIMIFNAKQLLKSFMIEFKPFVSKDRDPEYSDLYSKMDQFRPDKYNSVITAQSEPVYTDSKFHDLIEPLTPIQTRIFTGFEKYKGLLLKTPQGTKDYMTISLILDILRRYYWLATGIKPFNVRGNTPKLDTIKAEIMSRRLDFTESEYKSLMEVSIELDKELNGTKV